MNVSIWLAFISVVVAALALLYGIFKDKLSGAKEQGKISVILSGIDNKLGDIKDWQNKYEGKQEVYLERLVAVEQSAKSAHHRLDEHEEKINKIMEEK